MTEPFTPESIEAPHVSWWTHWRPAILSAVLFLAVVSTIVVTRQNSASVPTTTTTSTLPPGLCPDGSTTTCHVLTRTIKKGMRGEDVRRVQQRLKDLMFDPGPIDGLYGGDTMMAIWAFQSLVMKTTRDVLVDVVTPVMWDVMRGNVVIAPRRQPGTPAHAEIYLPEQTMAVFKGTQLLLVTHISSGTGKEWCEEVIIDPGEEGNNGTDVVKDGICGSAITPGGIYRFYNRKVGLRESKLGTMWNPVYFNFGIAVHGAMQVPKEPASHGCIRIPIFISAYFPAMVKKMTACMYLMASKNQKTMVRSHRRGIRKIRTTPQLRRVHQLCQRQLFQKLQFPKQLRLSLLPQRLHPHRDFVSSV